MRSPAGTASGSPELAPQFPGLDTLRAVGAFAVLTTHTMFWSGDYLDNGWLGTFWSRLDVGVALFFALSGFLLSRPWFARRELALPLPDTRRYLWKRFLRIYPVYAVVAVIALAVLTDNRGTDPRGWLTTLLLADIYVEPQLPAGLTQMWSLSTEVAFYLILPMVMALACGRRWRPAGVAVGLLAACLGSAWWLLDVAWNPGLQDGAMPLQWLPSYVLWFAAGIGLALLHVLAARRSPPVGARRLLGVLDTLAVSPGACWAMALGVLLMASTPLAGPALLASPTPVELATKVLLYAVFAVLLLTPSIFGEPTSRYARLMALPPLRHLGHVSYSLFCVHLLVLHFVMQWRDLTLFAGNGPQIWILTTVLSLAAAEALYWSVERPAMRLRGKVRPGDTRARQPATARTAR